MPVIPMETDLINAHISHVPSPAKASLAGTRVMAGQSKGQLLQVTHSLLSHPIELWKVKTGRVCDFLKANCKNALIDLDTQEFKTEIHSL